MDKSGGGKPILSGSSDSGKSPQNDIVIHTMQDDLAIVKQTQSVQDQARKDSKTKKSEAPVVDQVTNRKSENKVSLPVEKKEEVLKVPEPIPNTIAPKPPSSQKVVMAPPQKVKKHNNVLLKVLVVVLVFVIIGGAGAVGWKFILSDYFADDSGTEAPIVTVDVHEVIPQDVSMMLNYRINNEQDAEDIVSVWENTSNQPSSIAGLLAGDPRYLLENYSVDQIHYFLLEGEPQPYLLVPVTDETKNLVTSLNVGEVLTSSGWYVIHALNTDLYEQKIAEGVWTHKQAATSEFSLLDDKIGLVIGPDLLISARSFWGNDSFSIGHIEELFMNGMFINAGSALALEGIVESTAQPRELSRTADQRLLEIVPGDTDIVHIGANFVEDLHAWDEKASLLDSNVLEKPIVERLLSDLTTPYAYYTRQGEDGVSDIGLIIKIPESLSNQLAIGDASLEETLPAIIPLIAQRSANVEFTFADNTHNEFPLRYVNINGPQKALDYAIVDDYIFVSTSKEGMFTLLDTYNGDSSSLNTAEYWQDLFLLWGTIPQVNDIVIGRLSNNLLTSLLPIKSQNNELVFGFATGWSEESIMTVKGVMLLNNQSTSSTSPVIENDESNDFLDIE